MRTRPLGGTGIDVSVLGLGAGPLGDGTLSDADAERLLLGAIDRGVTFIDTARSYGASERRIGRFLGAHRARVVLSTKLGYGVEGVADWTAEAVVRGVDDALRALRTDCVDVVHLHSCDGEVLARGEVIDALDHAAAAGKVRVVAYSGENDALDWAAASGRFGALQLSVNVCDQAGVARATATAPGVGVIAKRPLANAPWRHAERPTGLEADKYWSRFRALELPAGELAWPELALRFTAFAPGVSTAITGTSSLAHLHAAADAIDRGPLPAELDAAIRVRHAACAAGWPGIV